MSLRVEQNWKWPTKTFLRTLCVVLGMKLLTGTFVWFLTQTSSEDQGGKFRPKNAIFRTFCTLKIGVLWVKCFKEQKNTYKSAGIRVKPGSKASFSLSTKNVSLFLLTPSPPPQRPLYLVIYKGGSAVLGCFFPLFLFR